jgi:hypothetical protein
VESFGKDLTARDLDQTLRLEYRAKLLNPKWAQKMAAQGSGGAFEISQRMTALVGWGGTADFKEDWVYDQVRVLVMNDDVLCTVLCHVSRRTLLCPFWDMLRFLLRGFLCASARLDRGTANKLRVNDGTTDG